MNRFRTKKKTKEASDGIVRASTDSDGPAAPLPAIKSSKTFRRKKNPEPEPIPELDLSTALPSSDDFRTSLLMSGLSARFSMLREQDDPKSKIGKASDDSVLFPSKRQSRLNDLGFASSYGLSDIAEVSSVNGSIRRPFAFDRAGSYHTADDYGTDDDSTNGGSMMNRAKPGEGNNLFGGRQKIYKIPVNASGSSKSLAEGGGGMGGRALYGDDVSQSAFQKLREREREQERQEREEAEQNAQTSRPDSPPLSGYNQNRETTSTTSSGGPSITRSSTAATSFTSQRTPSLSGSHTPITPASAAQGLDRTLTKGRRLYDTGLDQHLHEQQHSAMNRIEILTKQRALGAQTPPLGLSSPNSNGDRWERHQIAGKASLPNMRAASPPLSSAPMGAFDFGTRPLQLAETKSSYGIASPPLSPPMSEGEDIGVLAVQPNDRGKATALGTFSKPVQQYDENKYSQRQLQLHHGRETPPLRKHSPPQAFAPRQQQQQAPAPLQMPRMRADSNATYASGRSRSNSSAQRQFLPQDRIPEATPSNPQATVPEHEAVRSAAFLSSSDGSLVGSPKEIEQNGPKGAHQPFIFPSQIYRQNQPRNPERPPESQHPANRQRLLIQKRPISPPRGGHSSAVPDPAQNLDNLSAPAPAVGLPADSPTLGPTNGLSGMVRQHLRSDSNTSSIYGGAPSAGLISRFPHDPEEPLPQNEYTTKSNPWDADDWDNASYEENKFSLETEMDRPKAHDADSLPSAVQPYVEPQDSAKSSWEKAVDTHHTRDGSSETQKEREDFQAELASRRRRVQETMKSVYETESRDSSPGPAPEWQRDGHVKSPGVALLKSKYSRDSLVGKPKEAGQSKAMKMLGMGNVSMNSSSSPAKSSVEENNGKDEEAEMLRGLAKGPVNPPQTKAFRQARRDAQRDRERQIASRHPQRTAADLFSNESECSSQPMAHQLPRQEPRDRVPPSIQTDRRAPSRERGPPPVTQKIQNGSVQDSKASVGTSRSNSRTPSRTSRDRSSSDASGRSKSRNGRYRDDSANAMAEGISSSSQSTVDDLEAPSARVLVKSPGALNMAQQSPVTSPLNNFIPTSRNRSNSKSTPAGYFESHKLQPLQTGDGIDIGLSPRPSPITPYSVNSTPSLLQPSPSTSGANTPILNQGFPVQARLPGARKKSVNKHDISEPRFLSSTSRVPTVELPPGASLQNGIDAPPAIPPVNPRRRQARGMFGFGKKDGVEDLHSLPAATQSTDEMSTFSADESDKPKPRQRLRKSSSEGGNLNARARQTANAAPSPAMPSGTFPLGAGSPPRHNEGGMF